MDLILIKINKVTNLAIERASASNNEELFYLRHLNMMRRSVKSEGVSQHVSIQVNRGRVTLVHTQILLLLL